MNESSMLKLLRIPARLNAAQVAELLGFADHDIPVLARNRLLHTLTNIALSSSVKWFAAIEIESLSKESDWLSKATKIISRHWAANNKKRKELVDDERAFS